MFLQPPRIAHLVHMMNQVTRSLRFRLPLLPRHHAGTPSQHPKKQLTRNRQSALPGQKRKAQPASGSRTGHSRYQSQQSSIIRSIRRGHVGRIRSLHTCTLHSGSYAGPEKGNSHKRTLLLSAGRPQKRNPGKQTSLHGMPGRRTSSGKVDGQKPPRPSDIVEQTHCQSLPSSSSLL